MIIDIHVHPPRGKNGDACSLSQMVASARRSGIDRLCLLGRVGENGPDPTPRQIVDCNTDTIAMARAWPEAVIGFCYLNPGHDPAFLRDEMERTLVAGPLRGIKLWVAVNCRDSRLDPILARAGELGVPVLHHAWYKSVGLVHNESSPADIAHLAARFPSVQIIMAHVTGCGFRGVADIKAFPNVSVDTSGSQPEHGIVEYAVAALGAERVLFGSDAPGRDFSCQLARALAADITPRQRDLILGGNACRLLKLGDLR
jgi:hypothetical protein